MFTTELGDMLRKENMFEIFAVENKSFFHHYYRDVFLYIYVYELYLNTRVYIYIYIYIYTCVQI